MCTIFVTSKVAITPKLHGSILAFKDSYCLLSYAIQKKMLRGYTTYSKFIEEKPNQLPTIAFTFTLNSTYFSAMPLKAANVLRLIVSIFKAIEGSVYLFVHLLSKCRI